MMAAFVLTDKTKIVLAPVQRQVDIGRVQLLARVVGSMRSRLPRKDVFWDKQGVFGTRRSRR